MDPLGIQSAAGALKGAQTAGKDLGKIVGDTQADMEATVREQHRKRLETKAREEALKQAAEFKAFAAYEKQKIHQRELEKLKATAISKYGKTAWSEIEALKVKLEKERTEEDRLMDHDREKVQQVFWWCMTVSALITYFFKLYK
jgi:hypothetical protein